MLGDIMERPVVDGFLNSASQIYLPITYRANALAQMEMLRRARGYRARWYLVPEDLQSPVPAYGQLEYQVRVEPGSYVWGFSFAGVVAGGHEPGNVVRVQVTDACTETPFFSDYTLGKMFQHCKAGILATTAFKDSVDNITHAPSLINPRLVGQPGTLDVELYNSSDADMLCQFVMFVAEPMVPPEKIAEALAELGLTGQ